MSSRKRESGDKAVQLLATTVVLLGGVFSAIIVILSSSPTPIQTLMGFAGGCCLIAVILMVLRDPDPHRPKRRFLDWFRRKKPKVVHYELRVKPFEAEAEAPPSPPTAERIRELAQSGQNTWVPSKSAKSNRHNTD